MNSRDIADWMAYSLIEPFGPEHDELMLAQIAQYIVNSNLAKGAAPHQITDFMPSHRVEPMSPEAIARSIKEWKGF